MKRTIGLARAFLLALVLAAFTATVTMGKAEYTKKEKTGCLTCHTKNNSKELNDVGKCYAKNQSLKDCKPAEKK